MRPLLFLLLLLNWAAAFGQEKNVLVLPGKLPAAELDIGPYTAFYKDISGDTLPLETIGRQRFSPFNQKPNERTHPSPYTVLVTWLKFTLRNTHPTDTLTLLHYTGRHGLISLYDNPRLMGQTGISLPPQRRPSRFALFLSVPPGAQRTYFVRVVDYAISPTPVWSKLLTVPASIDAEFGPQALGQKLLLVTMSILTGCLFFMCLYALYSVVLTDDRSFLYYGLYTGLCLLFALNCIDSGFGLGLLFPRRMVEGWSPVSINLIGFFYSLFIAEILAIKSDFPPTWLVLRILLGFVAILAVLNVVEWQSARFFFNDYSLYDHVQTIPNLLITGLLIVTLFRSRSPIRYYLISGLLGLAGIGFVYAFLDLYVEDGSPVVNAFINYPYFWIVLCFSIEAFFFLLALAYRGRLIELENSRIQQRYAQDLEAQLAQRTREIEQKSRLLEQQHIRQLETEFEQKLVDTEMTALRAQMNPHFIFNCLNSIKLYTLDNEADKASDYLTKFSRLIRLVLENSRSELVSLQNELEALQLYIELEAMRFKQKVQFSIQVAPNIDQRYLRIPPLLLQPYVENAIWHGLMHKPEGGTVTVEVSQPQESWLHIEITDDGVGRQRAAELKSKSAGKHKSFGMQVTADRIRMINQLYNIQTQTQIVDLVDSFGEACGTKVILQIPV